MKKSDIVANLASRVSLSKAEANEAVNAVFEVNQETLLRGESVAVTGFGTFSTKRRSARTGRNPRTGESVAIAASRPRPLWPARRFAMRCASAKLQGAGSGI